MNRNWRAGAVGAAIFSTVSGADLHGQHSRIDQVLAAADLPRPSDASEWYGLRNIAVLNATLGYAIPDRLLFLAWDPTMAIGTLLRWAPGPDGAVHRSGPCEPGRVPIGEVCHVPQPGIDWSSLGFYLFDTLRVATLPSPHDDPGPHPMVLDGLALTVEARSMRDGGVATTWSGHDVRDDPGALQALALHRLVELLHHGLCEAARGEGDEAERARRFIMHDWEQACAALEVG